MGSRCNKFNYLLNALVSGEVSYGRVGSLITAAGRVLSQHAAAAPPPAKGRSGIYLGVTSRLKHIHNFITSREIHLHGEMAVYSVIAARPWGLTKLKP